MKLKLKEDPKEWRKAALLSALGLAILSAVLRWRRVLTTESWTAVLAVLGVVALCACLRPRWFRGWYIFSSRVGFAVVQFAGHAALMMVFILIVTPLGFLLRLAGKDPLRIKRPGTAETHWHPAKESTPLDRLF